MNKRLARKIENAKKRAQKRFDSAPWDTKEVMVKPIEIEFEDTIYWKTANGIIWDFFLSRSDKWPFISFYSKSFYESGGEKIEGGPRMSLDDLLIAFGAGKKILFKKANSVNFSFDLNPASVQVEGVSEMILQEPTIKFRIN